MRGKKEMNPIHHAHNQVDCRDISPLQKDAWVKRFFSTQQGEEVENYEGQVEILLLRTIIFNLMFSRNDHCFIIAGSGMLYIDKQSSRIFTEINTSTFS